jgi:hypothetical protein
MTEVTFYAGETLVNASFETEEMFQAVHKRTRLHDELVEALAYYTDRTHCEMTDGHKALIERAKP